MPRYRFSDFSLSTRKRRLSCKGQHLPLIPRYLDLLIFLIERRQDAVHRREIFDRVWVDVIVSDSALSQAIRTLRRTLGDDPRSPRFIRTVSRHGYQFTWPDVIEESDEDVFEPAANAAAESAHTRQKLGAAVAAAMTGATRAAAGSAVSGAAAGLTGGLALTLFAAGSVSPAVIPVLLVVGAGAGVAGGLGVGGGLAVAESSSRLRNAAGLTVGAAAGGTVVGVAVQWMMRWSLATMVGLDLPVGGGVEGLAIGAAIGAGYAAARRSGLTGRSRLSKAAVVAAAAAVAALALTSVGRPLVGGTLHLIAREVRGSQVSLTPLGQLVGEPGFGPVSQALIGAWEGGCFGLGVGLALLRRRAHADLTILSPVAEDLREA